MKARRKKRAFYRKGASLAMVLVSITILTIMGTLFTAIAMRSYEYSYAKLCKQQAYYTARSSIEAFYSLITSEGGKLLNEFTKELDSKYIAAAMEDKNADPTSIILNVGRTGGSASSEVVAGGFFDAFLGECNLSVRYADSDRKQLSIEATATYNGYSESARALVARTNKASSELKKIFDNTFCLQSPITTIVTERINGDIYISQPAPYLYDDDGNWIEAGDKGVYNHVLETLKKTGTYGGYTAIAGQYIRDRSSGRVITDTTTDVGKYNNILRATVYSQVQASTADSSLLGHTKALNMDNTPIEETNAQGEMYYNDWVEFYALSATEGGTVLDGNLYAHSRVLLGLLDRNTNNIDNLHIWNESTLRYDYAIDNYNYAQTSEYSKYVSDNHVNPYFVHGFGQSVFFDHCTNNVLSKSISKFRINGNMYLWDDARIENMDSTQTENALNGVKNNIYAKQNLYIDGTYLDHWELMALYGSQRMHTTSEATIYGDIFVAGDAFISGADIYGNVYCFGDELSLVNVNVYGNVYFAGSKFTADRLTVSSGTLNVSYNGLSVTHNLSGGNLVVAGGGVSSNYTKHAKANEAFGSTSDVGYTASNGYWGAVLLDCDVSGNFWSAVNTHIVVSKSDMNLVDGKDGSSSFGNIYVEEYLYIDLCNVRDAARIALSGGAERYGYMTNWGNGESMSSSANSVATSNNRITVSGIVFADRFQMRTNQTTVYDVAESSIGTLYVGENGLYIDGCSESRWISPQKWNIDIPNGIYSLSSGCCYNTRVRGSQVDEKNFNSNVTESDISGKLYSGATLIDSALESIYANILGAMGLSSTSVITLYSTVFKSTEVWKDKVISLYSWSAPIQYNENDENAADPEKTIDYARVVEGKNERGFRDIDEYIDYLDSAESGGEAGSVDGTTLTISQSVWFEGRMDFTQFDRVVIDTTNGNVHIKFLGGAEFGKPDAKSYGEGSEIVLTGGNLTFWYLYESEGYDLDDPTLVVNPYTRVGLVQTGGGASYNFDGLYIVSNDDALMYFGNDVSLNGFVYAPYSHLFLEPGGSGALNTLNGCMAIESLILVTDGDVVASGWIPDDVIAFFGGKTGSELIDKIVEQYENNYYDYVMPPLIMDSTFEYGDAVAELEDFNEVVWEFMGYY